MAASCCRSALLQELLLHFTDGSMRKKNYVDILKQHFKTSVRMLKLGRKWVFQIDNDPKHTSKVVAKWFKNVLWEACGRLQKNVGPKLNNLKGNATEYKFECM